MARRRTGPGKLADGFVITAWDFHRAVQIGGFLPTEHYLLGQAHQQSWAPGLLDGTREPRPFRFNFSELGRVSGNDRKTLARAQSRLLMYRVFLAEGDGSYWINKDYSQWLDADGEPRFTPPQIGWIEAPGPGSGCIEVGRSCAPVRTGAPAPQGGGAPAPQSPTTPPLPQGEAPSPLDGAGAANASARANLDSRKREKNPPQAPQGGGGDGGLSPPRGRRKGEYDWDALAERDTDVEV